MTSQIYWIENFTELRLGTTARPRGGDWLEDEVRAWKSAGIHSIVSALTDEEMMELDLIDESRLCQAHQIELFRFPVVDRSVPSSNVDWIQFIERIKKHSNGRPLVAHCRMGIGRASMIAASIMISYGVPVEGAFHWIEHARGRPVPDTMEQRDWIAQCYAQFTEATKL